MTIKRFLKGINMPMRVKKHLIQYHAIPLLFYTALALLMTWPLVTQFTTAVPGTAYDSWQNMWNMWWLKEALLHGQNPYYTTAIYYPHGTSLLLHTFNPINFLISFPVQALFGLVVAYNFLIIFSLSVSGYTAYLLAKDVTNDSHAALVAGTVFATSGYILSQVYGGHMNLMAAEWLPLAVLLLRRARLSPGWRNVLPAGLVVAINALCDWQYFLFALLWGAWYTLAQVWSRRRFQAVLPIGLSLGFAMLLVLPLLIPTAQLAARTPTAATEGGPGFRLEHSADLADFLIPSQLHPVWGKAAAQAQQYKARTHIQNKTAYLGVVTLSLAVFGVRRRTGRFWLASAVVFGVMAMGPRLQVFGTITDIPLPGAVLYEMPLVRISRYPIRFVVMTMLALSVLAALGTQRLLSISTRQVPHLSRKGNAILVILVGFIVFDHIVKLPMVGIYVPPFYAELGRDTEEYGILESPFYYQSSPFYMLYQTVHNKGLVGGYIARKMRYHLLEQIPVIQLFAYAQPVYDIDGQNRKEIAASVFSYFNIRYLILHSDGGALRYNTLLGVAEAAAGENEPLLVQIPNRSFIVYQVAPPEEPLPFIGIGDGWSAPQLQPDGSVIRYIQSEAELIIYSAEPHSVVLELQFYNTDTGQVHISVDGYTLPPLNAQEGEQYFEVPLNVTSGMTSLLLRSENNSDIVVKEVDIRMVIEE